MPAIMFGPSIFSVFRSRWKALWWSAGILLTAYCTVPAAQKSAQQTPQASSADMAAVAAAMKDIENQPSE
ncbi:hypothetical protein [Novosphingobium sp.]|uniref:hypothetical protein n=1 Tax=Novosphingobium sp. TaxID=1874826 RepID=UPI0025F58125|nr:hypothetical protein [Novosphingobium sp.]